MPQLKTLVGNWLAKFSGEECEDDLKSRVCYARLHFNDEPANGKEHDDDDDKVKILKEGIRRYPDNEQFYVLMSNLVFGVDSREGLFYAEEGLKRFHDNLDLLFLRAVYLAQESDAKTTIEAFHDFLNKAPVDHINVPDAFYYLAFVFRYDEKDWNKMKKPSKHASLMMKHYYKLGLEAEKLLLPRYLPYKSMLKRGLATVLTLCNYEAVAFTSIEGKKDAPITPIQTNILQKKPYLDNPKRKRLIIDYRKRMNDPVAAIGSDMDNLKISTTSDELKQLTPENILQAKPITLKEMNSTEDRIIYQGCVIELVIIEELNPLKLGSWIELIAQDEDGDVTRLFLINKEKLMEKKLGKLEVGTKLAIVNPCMQVGEQMNGIRVDDPNFILLRKQVWNICWFCAEKDEDDSFQKCSKCMKALYCSKECQQIDWKVMKHKLVCSVP